MRPNQKKPDEGDEVDAEDEAAAAAQAATAKKVFISSQIFKICGPTLHFLSIY